MGDMSTFNMQHGFVEAVVRGFRSSFLNDESYNHLSQCDNLEVIFLLVTSVNVKTYSC
jgi:V-type H+-transporting ATPase subunit d